MNLQKANSIAKKMKRPTRAKVGPEIRFLTCLVDTAKIEDGFARSENSYVSVGGEKKEGVRAKFEEFAEQATPEDVEHPSIMVIGYGNTYRILFIDGRHRFSVLRDAGVTEMNVGMDSHSVGLAIKYGIIKKLPKKFVDRMNNKTLIQEHADAGLI